MRLKETFVKSLSLGVGLAISIVLVAKICFELSYDRCYEDSERIFKIKTAYSQQGHASEFGQVSGAVALGFKQYVPGVKSATRMTFIVDSERFTDEQGNILSGKMIIADSSWFDVFPTRILAGDPKSALGTSARAMVARSFAERLGGVQEAVGQLIENEELPGYKITVGGVFEDFPHQSSQRYDILLSMESYPRSSTENWLGNDRYRAYVRLEDGIDYKMLDPAIRLMQEKNQPLDELEKAGTELRYYLAPLAGEHSAESNVRNMLIILGIVALLMLAISLLNYVLYAISAMVKRSKEVGVRKCYGAGTGSIYSMMMREAALDVLLSLVVAALLILALRSVLGELAGVPVGALFVPVSYAVLALVVALVFIVAALVPARLYSRIPIASAIRNYKENKRIWKLALLFVQIAVCTFLVCLVEVIALQYDKAINDKPGYEYEQLAYANLRGTDASTHAALVERLRSVPGVEDVQMSYDIPLHGSSGNNVYLPGSERELFNIADQYEGTPGLFDMLGIRFTDGRYPQNLEEVAVSTGFLTRMAEFADWSDGAVGKQICLTGHPECSDILTVCGVYEDYRIGTLTDSDSRASVKFYAEIGVGFMPFLLVKLERMDREVLGQLNTLLDEAFPGRGLGFTAYKDTMREFYSNERKIRNTVMCGCVVFLLIAIFGLMGYVRDESERRSKEVAVRKVNGATSREILGLFIWEMVRISLVAIVLADIGAYFVGGLCLSYFAEKISLLPWIFISADLVVLGVVCATVAVNSLRISRSNPVESLKTE